MTTFANKVINFNKELSFEGRLPDRIKAMNPFKENKEILSVSMKFYEKFYNDSEKRKFIIGINPGRLGAGVTGIPFTDTKRLKEVCKIDIQSVSTHEPSSVFMYDMIDKFGGPEKFYKSFFITSLSPLGFIVRNDNGNWVNCNYYDYKALYAAIESFCVDSLKKQITFGANTHKCYVLGKKNATYVERINKKEKLFDSVVVLEHPRYIQQYRSKLKDQYIAEYLMKLQ